MILCPTIADNETYLFRKWIFDDKNVFIVCDMEGKLNEWIKLFKNMLKGHHTLFIIDDCSAEGEINKKRDASQVRYGKGPVLKIEQNFKSLQNDSRLLY